MDGGGDRGQYQGGYVVESGMEDIMDDWTEEVAEAEDSDDFIEEVAEVEDSAAEIMKKAILLVFPDWLFQACL